MSTASPNLPALNPSTSYSFYPYPIKSTPTTSLRGLAPPTQNQAQAGPSTNRRAEITGATRIRERSERRALVGLRPAGFAIGRESEDLDLEEMTLEDERIPSTDRQKANSDGVGRSTCKPCPFNAADIQSPTPSEPDIERRQEDMNITSPSSPPPGENGHTGEGQDEDMVDLDGDMEDMDDDSDGAADGDGDGDGDEGGEDPTEEDSDEA